MSQNPDSVVGQGEFHGSIKPTGANTTSHQHGGHAIGSKIGNDAHPEFHTQVLPAGSAPSSKTHQPNATSEIPGQSYPNSKRETWSSAQDTIGGATSKDVHQGIGKPIQGMTSSDLHHNTSERSGLAGVGANASDNFKDRGLDVDHPKGGVTRQQANNEDRAAGLASAEDREPTSAVN